MMSKTKDQEASSRDLALSLAGFLARRAEHERAHRDPVVRPWQRASEGTPEDVERVQRTVVEGLEVAGQHVSPRVLRGALADAGGLDGYQTLGDYAVALASFIEAHRRLGRRRVRRADA